MFEVRLSLLCLSLLLALGAQGWTAEPATDAEPQPLQLEDPVEPLVPAKPRSVKEANLLESQALFATARFYQQRNKLPQALKLYQRALRYNPESLTILRQIVPLAFSLDRQAEAIRYALKVVELDPTDRLLPRLGALLIERGDLAGALELFESAIEAGGIEKGTAAYVATLAQMGDLYFMTENYEQAAECFAEVENALDNPEKYDLTRRTRKVLLGDPGKAYERYGLAYLKAGKLKQAEAAFLKAHESSSDKPLYAFRQAQVLAEQQEHQKALLKLEAALNDGLSDEGQVPYTLLADLLKELGRSEELIPKLEELRDDHERNADLGYFLADQYRQAGKIEKAEALYFVMIEQEPRQAGYEGLAAIFRQRKKPQEIIQLLASYLENREKVEQLGTLFAVLAGEGQEELPADSPLGKKILAAAQTQGDQLRYYERVAMGVLAGELEQFQQANEFFEMALKSPGAEGLFVFEQWSEVLLTHEKYEQAAEVLQRAIDENLTEAGNPLLHYQLSGVLEMAGKTDKALKVARQAASMREDVPALDSRVAWIYYHAGRYEEAIEEYEKLIDKYDGTEAAKRARLVLSAIYVTTKEIAKAEEQLEQVLDEYPDDPSACNDLGYLWADQGKNLQRALRMIQIAIEDQPDNKAYRDSLGWVYYKLGRYEEALVELNKATEGEDTDGVILDHLGDCYHKLNQVDKALDHWKRALKKFEEANIPDTDKIEEVRQKIKLHENSADSKVKPKDPETP